MTRWLTLLLLVLPGSAAAATLCVNTAGSGGCFSTIQQAVDAAGRGDVIEVAAGTYVENVVIPPSTRIAIQGDGPGSTMVDGNGAGTVVDIQGPNTNVTLTSIAIQNGSRGIAVGDRVKTALSDCAIANNIGQGGVRVGDRASLTVTACAITGNSNSGVVGGGIAATPIIGGRARLTVTASTISGNSSTNPGGGIWSSGSAKVTDSTISGNSATSGAGIWANSLRLTGSTISGNMASVNGGGVSGSDFTRGQARISDSTISGNTAGNDGGGIDAMQGLRLEHVTISGNTAASDGGGIARGSFTEKVTLKATLIGDNSAGNGADCFGVELRAYNGNLVEDPGTCLVTVFGGSPFINADPMLEPLQNNGGATETQALAPGSPAIGVITTRALCRKPDQRGVPRTVPCDLGAFELP